LRRLVSLGLLGYLAGILFDRLRPTAALLRAELPRRVSQAATSGTMLWRLVLAYAIICAANVVVYKRFVDGSGSWVLPASGLALVGRKPDPGQRHMWVFVFLYVLFSIRLTITTADASLYVFLPSFGSAVAILAGICYGPRRGAILILCVSSAVTLLAPVSSQ